MRALTENASTPATPTTAISSATPANPDKHERVQPLRRQHFGAHVLERRGALHRLVRRHLADDRASPAGTSAYGSPAACTNSRPATRHLLDRVIDRQRRAAARRSRRPRRRRRRRCGAAAACRRADRSTTSCRFDARRRPGTAARATLWLTITTSSLPRAVVVGEVAAGDERHAEHGEEAGRDDAQPRVRILFAVRRRVALDGELEAAAEACRRRATARSCRARRPRRRAARRCGASLPDRSAISLRRRCRSIGSRHVERQHLPHVVAGVGASAARRARRAACRRRRAARTRTRSASSRTTRRRRLVPGVMPDAAARQPEPGRRVRRRQARDVGEQHGRGHRQAGADPEQAGVDRDVERAHREARGEARRRRATSGRASSTPSTAPAPQSTRLSASSVRRSAPWLAPSAARTASSPSRRTERARIRLATFEQAMTNTTRGGGEQHEQDRSAPAPRSDRAAA